MLGCYCQIGYHTLIGMQISGSSRGVDEVEHLIKLHYQLPIWIQKLDLLKMVDYVISVIESEQ